MPFIPLDLASQSNPTGFMMLASVMPAAIAGLIFSIITFIKAKTKPIEARGKDYRYAAIYASIAAFTMIIGVVLAIFIPTLPNSTVDLQKRFNANSERFPKIQSEIYEKYGLNLTEGQVSALLYPYDKPTTDFSVYGSFDKKEQIDGAQFSKSTIYLVWVNGKFELSESKDGESFTPLEIKN